MTQSDMSALAQRLGSLTPAKRQLLEKALRGETKRSEPIAVVGLGCRFPGASSVESFWDLIRHRRVATSEVPPSRWEADAFYDPTGQTPGKMANRWGGFVDDVDQFDPLFFGISPREAENMDPQQRLLLEVAWEALEYGAIAPDRLAGSRTGTFVGIGGVDYSRIPARMDGYFERINLYSGTGNALSIAANRLSYIFDFHGPSLSVDTACSSALVAVHLAVRSLRNRECDAALAGGCNLILSPESTLAFSKAQMLSPTGACRPFDAAANGYVRGEGCGILVLKRLEEAVSDGNHIWAVVRGTAVNQDGRTSGIAAPNPRAQEAVIRAAFEEAQIKPADLTYLEAHGTGTPLGDPMEWEALEKVFRETPAASPCYVGSVKANVGHTETAAGAAGFVKTVLMLKNGHIPPQAGFDQLNPRISRDRTRLAIADQPRDWHSDGPRIAGVSAFGFGGTNAHLVLEQAPATEPSTPENDRPWHVLTLSAKSEHAVQKRVDGLGDYLNQHRDVSLGDLCFSENVGRSHFDHRLALIGETTEQLRQTLRSTDATKSPPRVHRGHGSTVGRPRVAFLFSGQGCQYPEMGRRLFETEPVFRDALIHCDEIFADSLDFPLLALLHGEGHVERLNHTRYLQPALFAIQYALAELWLHWGILPDMVLGHSIGEFAAACVAGVFDVEAASRLVADRARLMAELPQTGSMAVLFADGETVSEKIRPYSDQLSVAARNGPENTVISGKTEIVERITAKFEQDGIRSQKLAVSHAFHSPLMWPMLDEFRDQAARFDYQPAHIPFISSVTGELLGERPLDAEYWRRQIHSPVQFVKAIDQLANQEPEVVLEIGPSTTAIGMARRCQSAKPLAWLPSLKKGHDDCTILMNTLAEMYVRGVTVDWVSYDRPWPRRRLALPTYPFDRKRYWHQGVVESRGRGTTAVSGPPLHPILGSRLHSPVPRRIFATSLDSRNPAFLADHQIQGSTVMPAAGFVEQALAAAARVFGQGEHEVENLSIQQPLFLSANAERPVQTLMTAESTNEYRFEVHSRQSSETGEGEQEPDWVLHASGTVRSAAGSSESRSSQPIRLDEVMGKATHRHSGEQLYGKMAQHGLVYGPAFRGIEELQVAEGEALARLVIPPAIDSETVAYHVHPALLDAGLQTIAGIVAAGSGQGTTSPPYLPTFIRRTRVFHRAARPTWAYAVRVPRDSQVESDTIEADVFLLDDAGKTLVELGGVSLQRVGRPDSGKTTQHTEWLYTLQWREAGHEIGSQHGEVRPQLEGTRWLLFADGMGVAEHLAGQLHRRGGVCTLVRPGSTFRRLETNDSEKTPVHEIDPVSTEDYANLLNEWKAAGESRCGIIHLWNLDIDSSHWSDAVFLQESRNRGSASLLQLLHGVTNAKLAASPELYVVTQNGQAVADGDLVSPAQAASWGLGRVAATEHPEYACRLIDLDKADPPDTAGDILVAELCIESDENQVAYRGQRRFVSRLKRDPDAIDFTQPARGSIAPPGPRRLRLDKTGTLDSLTYTKLERISPAHGQVEIEVHGVGLNFSDVLKAMGLYPGITDRVVPVGIECSGTVTATGEGVERFRVGDPVMGVAPYSFATHAVSAEYALVRKPDRLSDEQAATIPITFLTAYYALCRLARLQAGERVLIHAAAGGVGQAAVQIAQHIGAEIFATAGSEQKRNFLKSLGVEHVMNSRTLEFADEIMDTTDRQGVDVVLNSLPGRTIDKSLSVLGAYGRFLEIGKIDIYQNRMVGLLPFQNNLSYFAIDLDRMLRERPDYIRNLFEEVIGYFWNETYRPLPMTCFRDDEVRDAFRYMAQRKNIGKIVVSFEERDSATSDSTTAPPPIRQDGTYLITGGLGSLGIQVAGMLARQGAGAVALMGRGEPSSEVKRELEKLRDGGSRVVVLRGDVTDRDSIQAALQAIPASHPPLRGVFHAAGVLSDALLHHMDVETFDKVLAPKLAGAWSLHRATEDCPLDHFVLFSSIAGVLGSPGQGNYAAGNTFLDGLAHYRRAKGLPAVSISWGPWSGRGMAADVESQLQARGMNLLAPDEALHLLEAALGGAKPHLVAAAVDWNKLNRAGHAAAPPLVADLAQKEPTANERDERDEALCQQLKEADPAHRVGLLRDHVAREVAGVMETEPGDLDWNQPLGSLGLDSLMAMELKAKLETTLGQSMPMGALLENPSVSRIAELFAPCFSDSEVAVDDKETSGAAGHSLGHAPSPGRSPVLKLAGSGDMPPLICIHPAGGDVSCYYTIARHIGDWCPVWTLRAAGLEEKTVPHDSVEQMASDYLQAIRAECPQGPYYLAGWSTGGIFAYEMGCKLLRQEADIGGLFLFDSPTPAIFQGVDLDDYARFLVDLVEFSNWFAESRMKVDYEELKKQEHESALRRVFDEAKRHGVLPPDASIDYLRRLVSVCREHSRAIVQYTPGSFTHPVHLFRPRNTKVLADASRKNLSRDLGWRGILGNQLLIEEVPGDHFSMMTEENASILGNRLLEQLQRLKV
ncbi:MAG: SDR family NAD(P)-dependent oxidoreductase [Planctomycetota bacterium]